MPNAASRLQLAGMSGLAGQYLLSASFQPGTIGVFLLLPAVAGLILTLAQIGTGSQGLGQLVPWRASASRSAARQRGAAWPAGGLGLSPENPHASGR